MTHTTSLKVLTQRWLISQGLSVALCACVSHSRTGERERCPDTENQSRVLSGHGARIMWSLTLTQRPRDQPLPWHHPVLGPGPARLCNAQILSVVIKIFYIPAKRLSSQIAALTTHTHYTVIAGPVSGSHFYWVTNNNSNHLFSVLGWAWLTQVMTACDVLWRPVMTTCTCHECHQALSPAQITSPVITIFYSWSWCCSTLTLIPDTWCSWHWHTQVVLAMTTRPSLE